MNDAQLSQASSEAEHARDGVPYYPEVQVQLTGTDGNAFAIMGKVQRALRAAGVDEDEVKAYLDESMSGDYDNLLRTAMRWVEVD